MRERLEALRILHEEARVCPVLIEESHRRGRGRDEVALRHAAVVGVEVVPQHHERHLDRAAPVVADVGVLRVAGRELADVADPLPHQLAAGVVQVVAAPDVPAAVRAAA